MVMHVPSNGLGAQKTRLARERRVANVARVTRRGHVATMRKATSSPPIVQQDPHYIELTQRIQEIMLLINNSAIPEESKAPLRVSLGELEDDLGRFINSRVPAAAGGRRRTRRSRANK